MSDYSWNMSDLENALGITGDDLEDEIKGLDESKALKTTKTLEEIERFIVNEDFDDIERASYLIRCGSMIQKTWVFAELLNLLKNYPNQCNQRILPEILASICTENSQVQKAFGQNLTVILNNDDVEIDPKLTKSTLYPVVKKLAANYPNDEDWEDALRACLKHLDQGTLIQDVLPEAISNGGISQPASARVWCCKVLGELSNLLPKSLVEEKIVGKALEMSQDTDHEVRSCMCEQLGRLAEALGGEKTKALLVKDFIELLKDEHEEVRQMALEHLPVFLRLLDEDTKKNVIWPIWKQILLDSLPFSLEEVVCQDFGVYFWNMKDILNQTDTKFLIQRYGEMLKSGSQKLRLQAVFNLPVVIKICGEENAEFFEVPKLLKIVTEDSMTEVRRKAALSFHEIVEILGSKSSKLLKESFVKLLSDHDISVVKPLLENLDKILIFLKDDSEEYHSNEVFQVLAALVTKFSKKLKWREQKSLFRAFTNSVSFFDSDILFSFAQKNLIPIGFNPNCQRPVTKTILKILSTMVRSLKRMDLREKLLKDCVQELKLSSLSVKRIFFLDFCRYSSRIGSKKYFRETLLTHVLDLARDPVVNVRLKVLQIAPFCRKCLKSLPKDHVLVQKWVDAISRLSQDEDVQVRTEAAEIQSVPLELFSSDQQQLLSTSENVLNNNNSATFSQNSLLSNNGARNEEDILDLEREEEEEKIKLREHQNDEFNRRRELEEAKAEFSRRSVTEKKSGKATSNSLNKSAMSKRRGSYTGSIALNSSAASSTSSFSSASSSTSTSLKNNNSTSNSKSSANSAINNNNNSSGASKSLLSKANSNNQLKETSSSALGNSYTVVSKSKPSLSSTSSHHAKTPSSGGEGSNLSHTPKTSTSSAKGDTGSSANSSASALNNTSSKVRTSATRTK